MECMLLPKEPTAPLAKVPHIDKVRYEGKDWFSYPQQRLKDWPRIDPADNNRDLHKYMSYLKSSKEIEPVIQTWLFFGLLAEYFRGNAPEMTDELVHWVYEHCTYNEDGRAYITTKTLLKDMGVALLPNLSDTALYKESCLRFKDRIYLAWAVLKLVPADFDPRIRASIGAVAEILSHSLNVAFILYKLPITCPTTWKTGYLSKESSKYEEVPSSRETMISNGWCPSDISRSMNNFNSLQTLHFLSKLNKSLPRRDHSGCGDTHCIAYQISNGYEVRHIDGEHKCHLVSINNTEVIRILGEGESIPLLRFVGDIENLQIEITQSTKETPYVAISHVWADGLGNQTANALNSCELVRLRTLVEALGNQDTSTKDPFSKNPDRKSPYVWIDTLCCPVAPEEAKNKSLTKLRNVYQDAAQVLVLDASLEAYKAKDMDLVEQLARIFTSGWLRRLWTLQEGALAESLYFQFADTAVSLDLQTLTLAQAAAALYPRKRIMMFDFLSEYRQLKTFYHYNRVADNPDIPKLPDLFLLNSALQYRSVSVPTDEPLCIACLLSIPTTEILGKDVPKSDRIKILWRLIAEKYEGLPASILFFEDTRINERGWRWAPSSLLTLKLQFHEFNYRVLLWRDTNLGKPTPNGLRVKLPGYRFVPRNTKDKQPWKSISTIAETGFFFRDLSSSKWYLMFDTESWQQSKSWTEEQKMEHSNNQNGESPLIDLISRVPTFLIRGTTGNIDNIGILTSLVPADEIVTASPSPTINEPLDGIPVRTHFHVICQEASLAQTIFMNAIERLAQELRDNYINNNNTDSDNTNTSPKVVAELATLSIQDSPLPPPSEAAQAKKDDEAQPPKEEKEEEEAKEEDRPTAPLKAGMKRLMANAIEQQPDLGPAIDSLWGAKWRESAWVAIGDWGLLDLRAEPLPEGQVWYVD